MTPKRIRIAFWMAAILMGAAQTWYTRHRIFSDGISYLEIARQYASGDWHGALNAYWSPLYSLVDALYLLLFRPAPYWEVSSLHVINYAAFLAGCWAFEKFLRDLLETRQADTAGLPPGTVALAGYAAILHGGLLMVGIGYFSPDMIAYFFCGVAAWLTLRIARDGASRRKIALDFAAFGAVLGLCYLDRAPFAPLSTLYVVAAMALVMRDRALAFRMAAIFCVCFLLVAAPFVVALSMKQGEFTLGESGRLNYGWEVAGADRSTHWQGHPGDLGMPVHPTRLILQNPVPVYEFGDPVAGSYPPWHDPSYWYRGIQPHLKLMPQIRVLVANLRTAAIYLFTAPAFLIWIISAGMTLGRSVSWRTWPRVYWSLILPAAVGIGLYCLVFVDKRYLACFAVVIGLTLLAGLRMPAGRLGKLVDAAAIGISVLFVLGLLFWLRPAFAMSLRDAAAGREGEYNVSWVMAQRFSKLGIKPGDRIAYIGSGISADWVRLAHARIVAEVPAVWERGTKILNTVEQNEKYQERFFALDEEQREPVYQAFRQAGAVLAVTRQIPAGDRLGAWKPLLDPLEHGYPKAGGQVLEQSPGYYRWLNP